MFVAPLMCVASALRNGTVYIKGDAFTFEPGKSDPSGVAYGSFATMTESQTGFGQLTVQVNKGGSYNDRCGGTAVDACCGLVRIHAV